MKEMIFFISGYYINNTAELAVTIVLESRFIVIASSTLKRIQKLLFQVISFLISIHILLERFCLITLGEFIIVRNSYLK